MSLKSWVRTTLHIRILEEYSAIEEHDTVRGRDWHATVRARNTVTTMKKALCERKANQQDASCCNLWDGMNRVERVPRTSAKEINVGIHYMWIRERVNEFIICVSREWMCVFITCVSKICMFVFIMYVSREWVCVLITCVSRGWMCVSITCVSGEWICIFITCVSREWMSIFISCVSEWSLECVWVIIGIYNLKPQGCSGVQDNGMRG